MVGVGIFIIYNVFIDLSFYFSTHPWPIWETVPSKSQPKLQRTPMQIKQPPHIPNQRIKRYLKLIHKKGYNWISENCTIISCKVYFWGAIWLFPNIELELSCCKKQQKSPNQETDLGNRGRLKVLNDTKLVVMSLSCRKKKIFDLCRIFEFSKYHVIFILIFFSTYKTETANRAETAAWK